MNRPPSASEPGLSASPRADPDNDYRLKRLCVLFVGWTLITLTISGMIGLLLFPERSQLLWNVLGPLIGLVVGNLLPTRMVSGPERNR